MFFKRERRRVPALNTTATADISFMLLIFFLVTTSMDTDKGLPRQLPPVNNQEMEQTKTVREGLLLRLHIGADNTMTCNDKPLAVSRLRKRIEEHVLQTGTEHVIQLEADRNASYDTYFQVQNEIVAAYRELRDERARKQFGHEYALCNEDQQKKLRNEIPQRVSEVYLTLKEGGQP